MYVRFCPNSHPVRFGSICPSRCPVCYARIDLNLPAMTPEEAERAAARPKEEPAPAASAQENAVPARTDAAPPVPAPPVPAPPVPEPRPARTAAPGAAFAPPQPRAPMREAAPRYAADDRGAPPRPLSPPARGPVREAAPPPRREAAPVQRPQPVPPRAPAMPAQPAAVPYPAPQPAYAGTSGGLGLNFMGQHIPIPAEGGWLGRDAIGAEWLEWCPQISRRHVFVQPDQNARLIVRDDQSLNGVFYDDGAGRKQLPPAQSVLLAPGDTLWLYNIPLRLEEV